MADRRSSRTGRTVTTAVYGHTALGVALGPRQCVADQLLANANVIRARHERVQLCQDLQTEFAHIRESLGVSRVNRFFPVHEDMILEEESAARTFA